LFSAFEIGRPILALVLCTALVGLAHNLTSVPIRVALIVIIIHFNLVSLIAAVTALYAWSFFALQLSFWSWIGSFGGYRYNFYKLKAHIVPKGRPMALASVLSNIEAVRIRIRPITLGVRLMANLTTGHLLLGLIANINRVSLTASFGVQLLFIGLELGVAVIQGYVFVLLLGLYSSEV